MARVGRFLLFVGVLVAAVVAALVISGMTLTDIKHIGTPRNAILDGGVEVRVPLPKGDAERLLPELTATTTGSHGFMFMYQGEPVRYDPCRPLEYVISPDGGPAAGEQLIHEAVERVSAVTGLSFEYLGTTTEQADFDRNLVQPELYADDAFVPILFGWSDEAEEPQLAGSVTGLGGSSSVSGAYGDDRYLTSGVVILDAPDIVAMLGNDNDVKLARAIVMHEIGHVVGLAHVDDDAELMNPSNRSLTTWGPGDLEALAIAGAGPCQEV